MPTVADPCLQDWSVPQRHSNATMATNLIALATACDAGSIRYCLSTPNSILFISDALIWCLLHRQGRAEPRLIVQQVPYVWIGPFIRDTIALDRLLVVEEAGDDLTFDRWVIVLARRLDPRPDDAASGRQDHIGYLIEIELPSQSGWIRWTKPRLGQFHGRYLPRAGDVFRPGGAADLPNPYVALEDSPLGPLLRAP